MLRKYSRVVPQDSRWCLPTNVADIYSFGIRRFDLAHSRSASTTRVLIHSSCAELTASVTRGTARISHLGIVSDQNPGEHHTWPTPKDSEMAYHVGWEGETMSTMYVQFFVYSLSPSPNEYSITSTVRPSSILQINIYGNLSQELDKRASSVIGKVTVTVLDLLLGCHGISFICFVFF